MPPIPPFRLRPEPASPKAEALTLGFAWAGGEVGHRHQLGGSPQWLQGDETPRCPACARDMTFYAQLDSINDDLILADCGLVYVFVCYNDFEVEAVFQSH